MSQEASVPRRPSLVHAALEPTRAALHLAHSQLHKRMGRPLARGLPAGEGMPVVVAPGLACNHLATKHFCQELRELGFLVEDWGCGTNVGPATASVSQWLAPMVRRIHALHAQTGQQVGLVGWSLGGIAVREASRIPGLPVSKVVTLGTPFADMHATNVGWVFRLLNQEPAWAAPQAAKDLVTEPPVPGASIYSKTDGVVHWQACVQPRPKRTRNIEVSNAGHFGMVLCPRVLSEVHKELVESRGRKQLS